MSSTLTFIQYVCEQVQDTGAVRYRKMFGDYMIYINDKPLLLVCDNVVYVKKLPILAPWMEHAESGIPYEGTKEHYILDIEDKETAAQVIAALEKVTPLPRSAKKKLSQ